MSRRGRTVFFLLAFLVGQFGIVIGSAWWMATFDFQSDWPGVLFVLSVMALWFGHGGLVQEARAEATER